jgi:arabinofuranan 3-O-arabinosyltransferase
MVRIIRIVLLLIAAAGVVRLFDRLDPRAPPVARFAAAALYVANPYVVVAGASAPVLQPYALLPWFVLAFARAVDAERGWKWPAATGLAFFAMGGSNAGIVPMLMALALPCYAVWAHYWDGVRSAAVTRALLRSTLVMTAVSLYWILPALAASAGGAAIVAATEKPRDVASTSSFAESLRGLGLWPLYGRQGARLWDPGKVSYLLDPAVVVASFALPLAAAVSAWRTRAHVRALAVILLALSIPVMVGLFPPSHPALLGRLFGALFDNVPVSGAFRTTNKIGALSVLALVLLTATGIAALARSRLSGGYRAMLLVAGVVVQLVAVWPAWTGGLHQGGFEIPAYWRAAGADLDSGGGGRVLVIPGGKGANYRWGMRAPDEVLLSVMSRPSVIRSTVLAGTLPPANLLAALDIGLQNGSLDPAAVSTIARYLGADEVLLRSDERWEDVGGARPSDLVAILDGDPGLQLQRTYGAPGQFTVRDGAPVNDPDRAVQPLRRYHVRQPGSLVRAASTTGSVVVAGDGFALPELEAAGALVGDPVIRFLGDMNSDDLRRAIDEHARIVLTDTNRRRAWSTGLVSDAFSPTLSATADVSTGDSPSLTLWPKDVASQTVTALEGVRAVESSPLTFGLVPRQKPTFALDGDPLTGWLTGHLGTAVGKWLQVDLQRPIEMSEVTLHIAQGGGTEIAGVRIDAGGRSTTVDVVPGSDTVRIRLPPVSSSTLRVTIAAVRGGAMNPVGFTEIEIPGVSVHEVTILPSTLSRLTASLDASELTKLGTLPFDVLLSAQFGDPRSISDDEERSIDRAFNLPVGRAFQVTATALYPQSLPAAVLAELTTPPSDQPGAGCVTFAYLDGVPVQGRLAPDADVAAAPSMSLVPCATDVLPLGAGPHRFVSSLLSSVRISAVDGEPIPQSEHPSTTLLSRSSTDAKIDVQGVNGPYLLVFAQGFDPRWRGSIDGESLGPPSVVDGYAVGWRIDRPGDHRITITFAPQRVVRVSIASSGTMLLLAVGVALFGSRRPPRHGRRTQDRRR